MVGSIYLYHISISIYHPVVRTIDGAVDGDIIGLGIYVIVSHISRFGGDSKPFCGSIFIL